MAQTLFLIDGNSLLNRAYYALPPLTTAEGIPTNAIYGFSTMLARLLADYQPNQILVAFDVSAPTFRHEAYTEYKATRKGMPDDLRPQVGMLKDVLDAWGIARLELAGYEADDIIGTAAKKGEAAGFQVYIVTADRDALQLISEQTTVLLTKRGIKEIETVDRAGLLRDYNLEPYQVIELKGLMGDSSDNIPGIPGVGEKTAMKLLEKYQSIAGVYENLDQEKGKLRERLEEHRDLALLSKELATIDCEVPLEIDLQFKPERNDEELLAVFQKLEFRTLVDRLRQDGGVVTESPADPITYLEFKQENSGDFDSNLAKATSCGIYFDSENFAIATDKENWYIPASDHELVLAKLQEKSKEVELFCNDSKAIFQAYADQNGDLNQFNIAGDISLAAYILDPVAPNDLTSLSLRYSDLEALPEYDDPIQAAVASAERIYQLGSILDKRIASEDMTHLYHDVELPLAKVLTSMEFRGIRCNTELLRKIATEIEVTLTKLRETIYDISGEEFNINSPKQLGVILFDKLGLPVIKDKDWSIN